MKKYILNAVADAVSDLCYYDRKEDEECNREQFAEAINSGEVTIDEMVARFKDELLSAFPNVKS